MKLIQKIECTTDVSSILFVQPLNKLITAGTKLVDGVDKGVLTSFNYECGAITNQEEFFM